MSSEDSDDGERAHFLNVVSTFREYSKHGLAANNRRRKDLLSLSFSDRRLLADTGYRDKLQAVDEAIIANQQFLDDIVADTEIFGQAGEASSEEGESKEAHSHSHGSDGVDAHAHSHSHDHSHGRSHGRSHDHSHPEPEKHKYRPTEADIDKLRSTLKQFVRDWSVEGKVERDACYAPIIQALVSHFGDIPEQERGNFRVLVPGAGLGRLAWDVAKLGFSCQGNEFSHLMLLSSYFILNRTAEIEQHKLYPYVHSFSNVPNREALLQAVKVPDVLPSSLPPYANFSLVAGDFEEVYGGDPTEDSQEPHAGHWDAVLTCFFIDTAKNVVNYLNIIHRILAPGGVWINLGPLLWHWENNSSNDPSIELDLEEVKILARNVGFVIKDERHVATTYTNNAKSMLAYTYNAAFWVATKADV